MSEAIRAESPLVERITAERKAASPASPGVSLREAPFLGYLNLRGNPDSAGFRQAVEGALGVAPPVEPNTVAEADGVRAWWLGPNEWLVTTRAGEELSVRDRLESALEGESSAVCDVTGYYTSIELWGEHARDVLEKGCTLDLHPRAFAPGQCAQTLLSHAIIIIRPTDETGSAFELILRRSFADYVFVWIEDAAEEFGLAVTD